MTEISQPPVPALPRERHDWRTAVLAATAALLLRAVAVSVIGAMANKPWSAVMAGHDGIEYFHYARALTALDLGAVPEGSRRFSAGWPLLIALVSHGIPMWLAAMAAMWGFAAGSILMFARLLQDHAKLGETERHRIVWAFAVAYPAWLYFQCFALGEAAFVFFLLWATALYLGSHRLPGYAVVGLAALIRPPGAMLALAFAANDARERRGWMAAWPWTMALIPMAGWGIATRAIWGATFLDIYRPHYGLPFSGFQEIGQFGLLRAGYIFACVAFFVIAVAMVLLRAARLAWSDPLANVAAIFCGGFLLFHLCIRDLNYHGRTIFTFNYYDRYLLGMLPFALIPTRRVWSWPVIAATGMISLGLTIYWGINYFAVAG